jgi:hypothetical protein
LAWFLACRPLWPYAGRHPRAGTPLSRSPTITRSPAPLPVEPRPDFLPPISNAPALCHYLGQHSMSWRYLGSGRWRNYLGLRIGNGLGGIACALVLSVSVLACLWFSRVLSRFFAFVCLSLACLCFSPSSDCYRTSGLSVFSGVEKFWPTPLYKASMYIV